MHEPTKQEELDRSRAKHMHTELVSQVFSSFRGIRVSQGTNFVIAAVLGLVFARAHAEVEQCTSPSSASTQSLPAC